jgi:hypothetical protein
MPLLPEHIVHFLDKELDSKFQLELLELLKTRIHKLCFEECQIDRIQCTLTPLCTRRFLLKVRLMNGLTIEDQPKFCYSVHKGIVQRDFLNKTVVYKPNDAYLYLIDFLDVFFHGDYRKLNKFLSKRDFKEAIKIFDDRIQNRDENFQYIISNNKNFMIFKFEEKIHVLFINENYALCNATRESITNLELLRSLCELFARIFFPEVKLKVNSNNNLEITTKIPVDVLKGVSKETPSSENKSKRDDYFWNVFPNDLDALSQYCIKVRLSFDRRDDLAIQIILNPNSLGNKSIPTLRYRDLRLIFNIIFRIYNDFYILWA